MAITDNQDRISGCIEVLYNISDKPELARLDDLTWDEYVMVWPNLPILEFEDPVQVMETLFRDPPPYGPLPRLPRELDIIQMCPNNKIRTKGTRLPNLALILVNTRGPMLQHLHSKNTLIHTSRLVPDMGLMMIPKRMESFFLTQPNSYNIKKQQ